MSFVVHVDDPLPSFTNLKPNNVQISSNKCYESLGKPHVESFDFMIEEGLNLAIKDLDPEEFELPDGRRVKLEIGKIELYSPKVSDNVMRLKSFKILPLECRQRKGTYQGRLFGEIKWYINEEEQLSIYKEFGEIPIMVKSKACWLNGMNSKQLIQVGEHEDEFGGYFIVKGHERLVRMFLLSRKNFPILISRNVWKTRGQLFSEKGIQIRCVQEDQTTTNNVLHYLTDGSVKLMVVYKRVMFFIPAIMILKSLTDASDEFILKEICRCVEDDEYLQSCVMNMLQELHQKGFHSQTEIRQHLGQHFRSHFVNLPAYYTDEQIYLFLIKRCVAIHLESLEEKFHLLAHMMKKLFAYVQGKCDSDNVDSIAMQELLLGGNLYLQIIKERLQNILATSRIIALRQFKERISSASNMKALLEKAVKRSGTIDHALSGFISTGNISTQSGLGLMQTKGLTIMAENLNRLRYMSHFRAVHRGSFFVEMRTTEARKLLPESWGFLCPVHTPDGSPCGLLNHLTKKCNVICRRPASWIVENTHALLISMGMIPIGHETYPKEPLVEVFFDGRIIGYILEAEGRSLEKQLRILKIEGLKVPENIEIVYIERKPKGQYPGFYLFTSVARMMRPVWNLAAQAVEMIGTFEQVYLDICISPGEAYEGVTTHQELSTTDFLSNLAALIPMPDCNQSPRNMYQCQMAKQTMGTPCHNFLLQGETKLYRLETPATPFFRTRHYDIMNMDNYPMGTNAVVAVISYTGYDMEDAMIINKASSERGFTHGAILKTEYIEIETASCEFERDPHKGYLEEYLENDGLPYIGCVLSDSKPFYCVYNRLTSIYKVHSFHGAETAQVLSVKISSPPNSNKIKIASIIYRISRKPIVGDKYASRAGQKGILSHLWPVECLPFTETGLVPDIIFNPHGFPSRMTIAMMIECMAGKSAALHGMVHDATPFRFSEEKGNRAIEYFGKLLEAGGYSYYGTERMYCGNTGEEMEADIFFGIIHYQRLRHMVSDKWQVRSTGPMDVLTRQPIKGRRRGGGIRFGEMERDALISHGTAFLLQDRLFECSDKTTVPICVFCGSIITPLVTAYTSELGNIKSNVSSELRSSAICVLCKKRKKDEGQKIVFVDIPYVIKYMAFELASMNIKMQFGVGVEGEEKKNRSRASETLASLRQDGIL